MVSIIAVESRRMPRARPVLVLVLTTLACRKGEIDRGAPWPDDGEIRNRLNRAAFADNVVEVQATSCGDPSRHVPVEASVLRSFKGNLRAGQSIRIGMHCRTKESIANIGVPMCRLPKPIPLDVGTQAILFLDDDPKAHRYQGGIAPSDAVENRHAVFVVAKLAALKSLDPVARERELRSWLGTGDAQLIFEALQLLGEEGLPENWMPLALSGYRHAVHPRLYGAVLHLLDRTVGSDPGHPLFDDFVDALVERAQPTAPFAMSALRTLTMVRRRATLDLPGLDGKTGPGAWRNGDCGRISEGQLDCREWLELNGRAAAAAWRAWNAERPRNDRHPIQPFWLGRF